jgi:hypothetical protein
MNHSLIANAMSNSFQKAKVFSEKDRRVSPSLLRCAVVTDLVGINGEDCENVAQHFMKHRATTSKKFYINHWANTESMRLGMKCYSRFLEGVNVDFVIEQRKKSLNDRLQPTQIQIKRWFKDTCQKIRSLSGDEVDDPRLVDCFDLVSPELNEG